MTPVRWNGAAEVDSGVVASSEAAQATFLCQERTRPQKSHQWHPKARECSTHSERSEQNLDERGVARPRPVNRNRTGKARATFDRPASPHGHLDRIGPNSYVVARPDVGPPCESPIHVEEPRAMTRASASRQRDRPGASWRLLGDGVALRGGSRDDAGVLDEPAGPPRSRAQSAEEGSEAAGQVDLKQRGPRSRASPLAARALQRRHTPPTPAAPTVFATPPCSGSHLLFGGRNPSWR